MGAVIVEIFTCLDLQEIAKELGKTFSFNNFEDYMQQKANLYTEWFDKVNISTKGSAIMLGYDWLIYSAGLLGAVGGSGGKKFGEFFLNMVFSKFFDKFALDNAEYYAYNWYLL